MSEKNLVSIRFAFPSQLPYDWENSTRIPNEKFSGHQNETIKVNKLHPGMPCLLPLRVGGTARLPAVVELANQRRMGATVKGTSMLTERSCATMEKYLEVPTVTKVTGSFNTTRLAIDCWKRKCATELLAPDAKSFAMEMVHQSATERETSLWRIPLEFAWASECFVRTAKSIERSQEKERFLYFLCAIKKQKNLPKMENEDSVVQHIFSFLCGPSYSLGDYKNPNKTLALREAKMGKAFTLDNMHAIC